MVGRAMVDESWRQRAIHWLIVLTFAFIGIRFTHDDVEISFIVLVAGMGLDAKERLIFYSKFKHFKCQQPLNRSITWNAVSKRVIFRSADVEEFVNSIQSSSTVSLLNSQGLSALVMNQSMLVAWNGGIYPVPLRGSERPVGPLLFMLFILELPKESSDALLLPSRIYARTRLPLPLKLTRTFCGGQLADFCSTLAALQIIEPEH
jgi:hypothetical protein